MKEEIKALEKIQLSNEETANLSAAQFKTLVTRMLQEPSKDLRSIKNIQLEMKDSLIEIKTNLQETTVE